MKIKECLPQIIQLLKSIDSKLHPKADSPPPEPIIQKVPVEVIKEVPDAFTRALESHRQLLAQVQHDAELSQILLHRHHTSSDSEQFIALIANAAQWNTIETLFDKLAQRCKDQQRPANPAELAILQHSLAIHNLIWQNQAAQLRSIELGITYDYKKHNRGNTQGDTIAAEWLPELINTAGKTSKLALVATH